MKTIIHAATILSLLAAPVSAAEWMKHASPDLGFETYFIGVPEMQNIVDGGVTYHAFTSVDAAGAMCMVAIGDYPAIASAAAELEADRDNFVKGMNATVTKNVSRTFPRGARFLPALEFDAESDQHHIRSLVVIDNLRVYQVAGLATKASGRLADMEKCVRSFTLTP